MARRNKRGLCPNCLHGLEHHPDKGPCRYGHDAVDTDGRKTYFGGCGCAGFGKKKSGLIALSPIEEMERLKNKAQAALDELCAHMRSMLVPLTPPAANGKGTSIASIDDVDRVLRTLPVRDAKEPSLEQPSLTLEPVTPARTRAVAQMRHPITSPPTLLRGAEEALDGLGPMKSRMLTILAQIPTGLTKGQILTYTGYTSCGATGRSFAALLRDGLVDDDEAYHLFITKQGSLVLGNYTPLATGKHLLYGLLNDGKPKKLKTMELAFLRTVATVSPNEITKGNILEHTGYTSCGATGRAFARLKRFGYVTLPRPGALRLAEELRG